MTDNKVQINFGVQPERTKPEQVGPQSQHSQARPAAHPRQDVSSGRKPLFGQ